MKNNRWLTFTALGILIFIMPGCLDIWITTQIRPDGSILQTIAFQGDSTEIATVPFALMKESGWKKEWTRPEKDKYKMVVTKEFQSVNDLRKSMNPADTNLQVVRINATLKKKFRWFFTRFIYEETAVMSNPFKGLDYRNYLSDEEIRLISLNEENRKADPGFDSVKYKVTEKRFEDYLTRSIYEDFHRQLLSVLNDDKSLTLSRKELDGKKESILRTLMDSVKGGTTDDILKGIGLVVKHPDIQVIRSKYADRFNNFQNKLKFYESASDDNYKFAIRMPGLLLQTNSPKIEGASLGWELTYYDFFFKDYSMTAESRMINPWAFLVAGLVLLAALGSLIAAWFRKR